MDSYPKAAMERAMKIQEVILRAMAKKITWWQVIFWEHLYELRQPVRSRLPPLR